MIKELKIKFSYKINGQDKEVEIKDNYSNDDFDMKLEFSKLVEGNKFIAEIKHKKDIEVNSLVIEYDNNFSNNENIFVNGYESWTDSREFKKEQVLTNFSRFVPRALKNKYGLTQYGDYDFKKYSRNKGVFHGFTYGYIRNGSVFDLVGSLTERKGYTIINYDMNKNNIVIEKDMKGIVIKEDYKAFELVFLKGAENEVFDTYFKEMNIDKPKVKPMTGYTSWYHHYQNISEDILLTNLKSIVNLDNKVDIFQVDDGFQTAVGDWLSIDNSKFPNGMKIIADTIKKNDLIPGLWLAPFACEFKSEIVTKHPDWILRNADGSYCTGGSNWGGFYALDFYNKEVQEYLRKVFNEVINVWGFEMVKLDFLYATCIVPRGNKTRGEIMCDAMEFLRECVGDKLILGCGVPLGPAFGKVDFCRIGCDIGLDWDDKWHMRLLHRERVSTKNALINTIGRRQLNGRAFLNDPDVFLLRDENISLSNEQKETLALVNHIFGSLLFTSDDVAKYTDNQKRVFDKTLELNDIEIISVEQDLELSTVVLYKENGEEYIAIVNLENGTSTVTKR